MTVAVSSRWFGPRADAVALSPLLRRLGVREVYASLGKGRPSPSALAPLRNEGISFAAVGASGDAIDGAEAALRTLKAQALVVEDPAADAPLEDLLRSLHALLRRGVPVGVRNDGAGGLLGFEEVEHVLSDLKETRLWLDPARALAREGEPPLERWADRYAGRTGGVFLGGAEDGSGPREDGSLDWGTLARLLPRDVPWVLDLSAKAEEGAARRGVLLAKSLAG